MYCLSNFCFLCLNSHQNLINIKHCDRDNKTLHEKLNYCMIDLKYVRPVSQTKLCSVCCDILRVTFEFQRRCLENNEKLSKFVQQLSKQSGIYADALVLLNDEEYLRYKNKKPDRQNGGHANNCPSPENDLYKYLSMYDLIKLFPKKTRKENAEEFNLSFGNVHKTLDVTKIGAVGTSKTTSEPIKPNEDTFKEPDSLKLNPLVLHKNTELINKINHFDETSDVTKTGAVGTSKTTAETVQHNEDTFKEPNSLKLNPVVLHKNTELINKINHFDQTPDVTKIGAAGTSKTTAEPIKPNEDTFKDPNSLKHNPLVLRKNTELINKITHFDKLIENEEKKQVDKQVENVEQVEKKSTTIVDVLNNIIQKNLKNTVEENIKETISSCLQFSNEEMSTNKTFIKTLLTGLINAEKLRTTKETPPEKEAEVSSLPTSTSQDFELLIASSPIIKLPAEIVQQPSKPPREIRVVNVAPEQTRYKNKLLIEIPRNFERKSANLGSLQLFMDTPNSFYEITVNSQGHDKEIVRDNSTKLYQELLKRKSEVMLEKVAFKVIDPSKFWIFEHDYAMKIIPTEPMAKRAKMAGVDNLSTVENLHISNVQTVLTMDKPIETLGDTAAKVTGVDNLSTGVSTVDNWQISNVQTVLTMDKPIETFGDAVAKVAGVDNLSTGVSTVDNLHISNVQTVLTMDKPIETFGNAAAKVAGVDNLSTGVSTVDNLQISNVQTVLTMDKPIETFGDTAAKVAGVDNLSTGVSTVDNLQISNVQSLQGVGKPIEAKKKFQPIAPKPGYENIDDLDLRAGCDPGFSIHRCRQCSLPFMSEQSLRRHMTTHVQFHECSICHKRYEKRGSLKRHLKQHNEEQIFLCPFCPAQYGHLHGLKKHCEVIHKYAPSNFASRKVRRKIIPEDDIEDPEVYE